MHIKFHLACSINLFWPKYSNDILLIKLYLYISTCQFPLEFGNLVSIIMFYNFNFTSIITELHIANQFYIIISYSIIMPCQSYLFVLLLTSFIYNISIFLFIFLYIYLFIDFSQSFILLSVIHFFLYKMIFQCYSIIFLFIYSSIFLIVHHLFYCH